MHLLSAKNIFSTTLYCFLLFLTVQSNVYASPTITNIEIRNIDQTSVTIVWKTDVATNSQISYGEKSPSTPSSESLIYDTDHSVTLTGLRPNTKYYYVVTSKTQDGNSISSDVQQFSTLSFTFSEDYLGTFGNINATPTPTPYINPYAQYLPQNTAPQYNTYPQQPLYIVPPVVYQQTQTAGQTLGETNSQQALPTSAPMPESVVISLVQSGIWGGVILFGILIVILILLFNQLMKNRKELHDLQQQMLKASTVDNAPQRGEEPGKKVYRFDVRS